jgi:hypothetical protein
MKLLNSIIAAAAVQLLAGCAILFVCGSLLAQEIYAYHFRAELLRHIFSPSDICFLILPIGFALLSIVTAIGLLRVRAWARKSTIFLSTVPVLGCALLVLLRPPWVFPPSQPDEQYAILTIGSGFGLAIYEVLLVILIPVSIWWLVLFTRASVKAQFRTK